MEKSTGSERRCILKYFVSLQSPAASQREIAEELGVSLGAINFCVKALIEKGHKKLANRNNSKNQPRCVYVLTAGCMAHPAQLETGFIKRKIAEFEATQAELEDLRGEFAEGPAGLMRK